MEFICGRHPISDAVPITRRRASRTHFATISHGEINVRDLVDIAIPSVARAAAESMGLTVQRSVTHGTWVRRLPRDEAEIAVECLRDFGFAARIVDSAPDGDGPAAGTPRAA
jgi:hypothetical protein